MFVNPITGEVLQEGDLLKQPALGETLRVLQSHPYSLINGTLAEKLVGDIQDMGGYITLEELASYKLVYQNVLK